MRRALARGDEDAREVIRSQLKGALADAWVRAIQVGYAPAMASLTERVTEDIEVRDNLFALQPESWEILHDFWPYGHSDALCREVMKASGRIPGIHHRGGRVPVVGSKYLWFELGPGEAGVPVQSFETELFVEPTFHPLSAAPTELLLEMLGEMGPEGAQWVASDSGRGIRSGVVLSGDQVRIVPAPHAFRELALDIRSEYFSEVADKAEPEFLRDLLLKTLKREDPKLAKKIKKAKLPDDVMADYAVAYFTDPEEGLEILNEAMGSWGYEGTRGEVLLRVDRAALLAMGITEGKWWDGAPWKLVDLPPQELAYEGTLMRHCVGRHSMGYQDSVEQGDIYVWSLRSKFNKPILTFEVNAPRWEDYLTRYADDAEPTSTANRGAAITQLKGKLNRVSGEDPQEARVLHWIFAKLGVDPRYVSDFHSGLAPDDPRSWGANPGRNFDRPCEAQVGRVEATKDSLLRW